jgi:hypothetical protein
MTRPPCLPVRLSSAIMSRMKSLGAGVFASVGALFGVEVIQQKR